MSSLGVVNVQFFNTAAAIGATAFTVLFMAAQFSTSRWANSRFGKISLANSLFELFTVTVVSLSVASKVPEFFEIVAFGCFLLGYALAILHRWAYRRHPPFVRTAADKTQNFFSTLPWISYGVLLASLFISDVEVRNRTVVGVCVWLVISGAFESFVIMSPSLLGAETLGPDAPTSTYEEVQIGRVFAGLFTPSEPVGSVVLAHEIWGVDPAVLDIAEELSNRGFIVLVPDLYRSWPTPLVGPLVMTQRNGRLTSRMANDLLVSKGWLERKTKSSVCALGFSLGGTLVLRNARANWVAIACFYPEVSGRAEDFDGACPVFARFGSEDRALAGDAERLRDLLGSRGIEADVFEEPGAGHSYMSMSESAPIFFRPWTRRRGIKTNKKAGARSWNELDAFFRSCLEKHSTTDPHVR